MVLSRYFIFLILLFPQLLKSQDCPVIIDDDFEKTNLRSKISVFSTSSRLDVLGAWDSIQFSRQTQICTTKSSSGFKKHFYWVAFSVTNPGNQLAHLLLELDNPHIDTVEFYMLQGDTAVLVDKAGDMMPFAERNIPNRRFIFPIALDGSKTGTYILMIDKRTGAVSYPLKLWDKSFFKKREGHSDLFHLLYFGGVWFLALFSMVMGLLVKNKRIFIYGVYIVFMGIYLFIALGYATQYFYPESTSLNNITRSQFMLLTLSSFVIFSIYYLNLDKQARIYFKILISIAVFLMVLSVLSIVFSSFFFEHVHFFLQLVYGLILISAPLIFFAIGSTFKENRSLNLAYLGAFSMLMTGTALYIFAEFGWINEDFFMVNPILVASVFELFILSTSFIFEIKTIQDKKNQLLKQKAEFQKSLSDAYITGTEEEGSRISKELHDNIGSRLALLKNKVEMEHINRSLLKNEVSTIFQDVKEISNQLSPNKLQILGFVDAAESLFNELAVSTSIKVNFYAHPTFKPFNPKVELQLYRVLQELVQNIIKHSLATEVDCQILLDNEEALVLTVDDNGLGFDASKKDKLKQNGLKNMMFRLESINCSFEISSAPGKGTHIVIWCKEYQNL